MNELLASKRVQVISAVLLLGIIVLGFLAKQYTTKRQEVNQQLIFEAKELDRILNKKDSPRKEENLNIRRLLALLAQKNKDIIGLSVTQREKLPEFAPLEFKEELLKTQMILKENAGFPIPEGIGFKEYIGGIIPQIEDIPVLTRQLYLVKEIVELMINAKINSVSDISWQKDFEEKNIYKAYLCEWSFVADTDSLIRFLVDLQKAPDFIIVHSLIIKRLPDLKLGIEMAVKIVDFKTT